MKKITLGLLLTSSLMMSAEVALDQTKLALDIKAAKAQKSAADAKLKALEAQLPQNQEIMTHIRLGYTKTDGNTHTETFSINGSFKKAWGKSSGSIIFDSQYGNADGIETKSKYFVELEYDYLFTDTLSFIYLIGYKNDKFSSYNYQAYTGPGLKWTAHASQRQKLNLKGSILYSEDKLQNKNIVAPASAIENYTSFQAKLTYELKIFKNFMFNQELSYRASFEEANKYFIYSKSSLLSKLSDIFSVGVNYKIDYANEVATGIVQRDNTLTALISLDY